ncbi:hypothetical protein niasHS_011586 [Heterodera schachtii]|uniref:Uncharacterized protein n=1 Tax=Heterodera schachtii TaxID=97005 RepID=A0ABD2INK3_HETSC
MIVRAVAMLAFFLNVSDGMPNALSTANGIPSSQFVQNPSIMQQMAMNNHPINNKFDIGTNSLGVNQHQPVAEAPEAAHQQKKNNRKNNRHGNGGGEHKMHVAQRHKTPNKGIKLKEKRKLRIKKSKDMGGMRSKVKKLIMFFAFLLLSVSTYTDKMPSNVMIQYDNKFVPIEQKYLSCQNMPNGGVGHNCEFSLDNLEVDEESSKLSIWANVRNDNSSSLQKLSELDIGKCEVEDGRAYCGERIEIKPDQIDQLDKIELKKVPTAAAADRKLLQQEDKATTKRKVPRGGRKLLQQAVGGMNFLFVNKCPYDITVIGAKEGNNIIPPTIVPQGQTAQATVAGGLTSCRLWAETDCGQALPDGSGGTKACSPTQADPTVSLFEWSTDQQGQTFYDISYVDAASVPMSVFEPTCAKNISYNPNLGNSIQNLWNAVPAPMQAVDQFGKQFVKSPCQAYDSAATCCTGAHNLPTTCGVFYQPDGTAQTNNMTQAEIDGLNAMHTAFPSSYSYAYDDKIATGMCPGVNQFTIGFGTNCNDASCS